VVDVIDVVVELDPFLLFEGLHDLDHGVGQLIVLFLGLQEPVELLEVVGYRVKRSHSVS
jgi:hypothetical protein